jgi:hypothetical protein
MTSVQAQRLAIYRLPHLEQEYYGVALNADPSEEDVKRINKTSPIKELHMVAQAEFSEESVARLNPLPHVTTATFVAPQPDQLFYKLPNLRFLELPDGCPLPDKIPDWANLECLILTAPSTPLQLEGIARLPKLKILTLPVLGDQFDSLEKPLSNLSTSDSLEELGIFAGEGEYETIVSLFSEKPYKVWLNGSILP